MRAIAAPLVLLAALHGGAARAGEAGTPERPGPIITRIDLKGLRTVRPATVRRRMSLVAGERYRPELVLQDRDRLMETGRFDDVRFFPRAEGKGVALTVEFVEAPVVRAIRFESPEGGPPRTHLRRRTMRAHLSFRKGDRLRRGVAEADASVLTQALRNKGYLDAVVRAEVRPVSEGEVEVVYRIADGRRLCVREIRIRGNRAISDRALLRAHFVPGVRVVESRTRGWLRGGRLTEEDLRGDVRRLEAYYRLLGYLDARVRVAPLERLIPTERRQPVRITFLVEEGERYRVGSVEIRGNRSLTSDTVRAFTSITPGGVYSERRLVADRGRIRDLFGRHGRAFTRVRTESRLGAEPNTMDVVYHIRESPVLRVGEVHIRGRTRTHDNVARREIELRPGEVYDSLNLERSRRNLMRSGLFDPQSLSIDLRPGDRADEADVLVDLAETTTGQLSLGASIDPESGDVVGQVSIRERNFDLFDLPESWYDLVEGNALRGAGQSLGLSFLAGSDYHSLGLSWRDPWIGDTPAHWSLSTSLFDTDRSLADYDVERVGGSVGLSRRLFGLRPLRIGVRYALEDIDIHDVDDDASALIREEEGRNLISSVNVSLSYDTRDWPPLPSTGWYLRADEKTAGGALGGDRDFWQVHLAARRYFTAWRTPQGVPFIGAIQGRASWAGAYDDSERVPLHERFFAGGIASVRGFDYRTISPRDPEPDGDAIGGNFRLVQNSEFIVPLPLADGTLRASVFHDVGFVWPSDEDFDLDEMKRSWGVGLWIVLPRQMGGAPIRIYWAWPVNDDRYDDTDRVQVYFTAAF